jgi:hypothetical protein
MRLFALAPGMLCLASTLAAQAGSYDPADVASIDAIIGAYYEVVSGPAGQPADRARDEYLHHPSALIGIPTQGDDGRPTLRMISLGQYHDAFGGPRQQPFYEWELNREVQRFGNVAHVWSTYASSREPGGEIFTRGINSIELFWDGDRWWITSWSFDQEREGLAVPEEYLPEE